MVRVPAGGGDGFRRDQCHWLEGSCWVPGDYVTIEVNGHVADEAAVSLLEHEGWGHFTAMQVRGGRTRGLDLHLARLEDAHRDVYGRALCGEEARARIRHALGGQLDASVRAYGYWAGLIVAVRGPRDMPLRPHSMTALHFQRPLARLKHVGSWGQGRFRQAALAAGLDEGLLTDEAGRISEGTKNQLLPARLGCPHRPADAGRWGSGSQVQCSGEL